MDYGTHGRYADVDLTTGECSEYPIPSSWHERNLGGRGIGARILADELSFPVDPLGSDNILVFATGPFQGTGVAGASRNSVLGVSPVTGAVSDSTAGGFFPHRLGRSGFDGLIVRGQASGPAYVCIDSGQVAVHDAQDLWGEHVLEVEQTLKERHENAVVSTIGIAGENGVQFACALNDRNRAAGRPGFGCVMGAKNLKAVVVCGAEQGKPVHSVQRFESLKQEFSEWVMLDPGSRSRGELGTAQNVLPLNELGILPTRNYQEGVFAGAELISGERLADTFLAGRDTCTGCPIACKRVIETEYMGQAVVRGYGGLEYESLAALGSMCLVDDLQALSLANQKCNQYGLDTIATGAAIAAAMEATEAGLIKEGGIVWGDAQGVIDLVDRIALREGLGELLGEGMRALEEAWGPDFILHVKGQAMPMHDPRAKKGMGISYATSPRGATHMEGFDDEMLMGTRAATPQLGVTGEYELTSWRNKAEVCRIYENLMSFTNSLIMCAFVAMNKSVGKYYAYDRIRDLLEALTGRTTSNEDMLAIGERNYCQLIELARMAGYTEADDNLPQRFKTPIPAGPCKGEYVDDQDLERAISEYRSLFREC